MFCLAALALLSLQGRQLSPPLPEPLSGRLVDVFSGEPVVAFRFEVRSDDAREACETDLDGRFRTERTFRAGRVELRGLEPGYLGGLPNSGGCREVEWSGSGQLDVFMVGGDRIELELEEGRSWPDRSSEGSGLFASLSAEAQVEQAWSWALKGAYLREPLAPGGPRWARFGAKLDPRWISSNWRARLYQKTTTLVVRSSDGLWLGRGALDAERGPCRLKFELRSALRVDVHELVVPADESAQIRAARAYFASGQWAGKLGPEFGKFYSTLAEHAFGAVRLRLTRVGDVGGTEPVDVPFMPIGGELQLGAVRPGRWRVEALSEFFPPASVEVQLAPGEVGLAELTLGERKVIGEVRVVVRDHDGDLLTENGVSEKPDGVFGSGYGPNVRVSIERVGGAYRKSAPSWSKCGTGIDVWCELEGERGAFFREASFPKLLPGDYRVSVSAPGRRIQPASQIVHPGEQVTFTLELPAGGPGDSLQRSPAKRYGRSD